MARVVYCHQLVAVKSVLAVRERMHDNEGECQKDENAEITCHGTLPETALRGRRQLADRSYLSGSDHGFDPRMYYSGILALKPGPTDNIRVTASIRNCLGGTPTMHSRNGS